MFFSPCTSSENKGKNRLEGGLSLLNKRQADLNYLLFDPMTYLFFKTCLEFKIVHICFTHDTALLPFMSQIHALQQNKSTNTFVLTFLQLQLRPYLFLYIGRVRVYSVTNSKVIKGYLGMMEKLKSTNKRVNLINESKVQNLHGKC